MRIALCDDCPGEQEQFIRALHGWAPTRQPERFLTGGRQLRAWATLSQLEQKLNDSFLKLNRSARQRDLSPQRHGERLSAGRRLRPSALTKKKTPMPRVSV